MISRFNIVYLSLKLNYDKNEFNGFGDYNESVNSIEFHVKNKSYVVTHHDFSRFPNLKKLKITTSNIASKFDFGSLESL